MIENLNQITVPDVDQTDYKRSEMVVGSDRKSWAYFDNLEWHLIANINDADVVLGCVAWLTNDAILSALAEKKAASIVVQKEDFLRPDLSHYSNWVERLRSKYAQVKCDLVSYEVGSSLMGRLNYAGGLELQPIRCVGNYNSSKKPAFPRSHHKFVLFCRLSEEEVSYETENYVSDYDASGAWTGSHIEGTRIHTYVDRTVTPYAVWTGSFNFTQNATQSFENAVVLTDKNIVRAYLEEFAHIYALSEELDWTAQWVEPEYRIGT